MVFEHNRRTDADTRHFNLPSIFNVHTILWQLAFHKLHLIMDIVQKYLNKIVKHCSKQNKYCLCLACTTYWKYWEDYDQEHYVCGILSGEVYVQGGIYRRWSLPAYWATIVDHHLFFFGHLTKQTQVRTITELSAGPCTSHTRAD